MSKLLKWIKRVCWIAVVGLIIAFHNTYNKEFKSVDSVTQEIVEEDEEE